MELPKRKNIRLRGYDYSQNGAYFITICTHNRQHLFGSVGAIHESPAYKIVQSVIEQLPERYGQIYINKYVIMPNHIHLIIVIQREWAIRESPLQNQNRSAISQAVGFLKMNSSKHIRLSYPEIYNVWQRGFHDHIIRNEDEYPKIWQYIDTNPQYWAEDRYCEN